VIAFEDFQFCVPFCKKKNKCFECSAYTQMARGTWHIEERKREGWVGYITKYRILDYLNKVEYSNKDRFFQLTKPNSQIGFF
jgi:hypothetical protein